MQVRLAEVGPGLRLHSDLEALCLLEKAGAGAAPGVDFGQGGGAVRFSYASSEENMVPPS